MAGDLGEPKGQETGNSGREVMGSVVVLAPSSYR
jgi:hypothetical protein